MRPPFAETFTSLSIDGPGRRLHAVIGGEGPPLLLLHGRPETWCARRLLLPALARHFEVVAVDPRGTGLSGAPAGGCDPGALAGDLVGLLEALGHPRDRDPSPAERRARLRAAA